MQTVDLLLKGQTVDENGNFIVRQQPNKSNTKFVEEMFNYDVTVTDTESTRRNKKIIKPITKEEVESLLKEKVGPYSDYEIQRIVELQRYFDGFAYTPKSSEGGRLADDGTDPLYLYQSNMATIGRILDTQVEEDAYWITLRKEERRARRTQEAAKKSTNAAAELAAKRRGKLEKNLSPPLSPHSESNPAPSPKDKSKKSKEPIAKNSTTRQFPPEKVDDFVHRGDAEPDDDVDVVGGGEAESFSSEDDDDSGGEGSHNFYSGGDSDENSDMFPEDHSGDSDDGPIRKKVKIPTARHRLLMDEHAMEKNGSRRYRARLARLRDDVLNASKVAIEKDSYSKLLAMARSLGPELRGNRPPIHTFLAVLKPHMDKTIGSQNPTNVPSVKGLRNVTSASASGGKTIEDAEPSMEYYSEPFVAPAPKASPKRLSSIYGSDSKESVSDAADGLKSSLPVCVDEPEPLVFGYGTKNMQIRMLTAMLKFRKDQTNALKRIVRQLADQLIFTDRDMKERLQKNAAADAKKVDQLETRIDELLREQNYIYHKMYGSAGQLAAQVLLQEQAAAEEQSKTMDAVFGRGVSGETPDALSPATALLAPKELLLANGDTPSKAMIAEAQRVARAKKYRKDVDDAYKKLKDTEVAKAVVRAKGTSEQIENSLRRLEAEIAEQKIITLNATLHSCKTIVCRNRAMKANRSLERELMERHDLQTIHATAKLSNALVNAFGRDAQALFTNVTPQSHGDAHGHLRDLPGCVATGESGTTTAYARRKSLVTGAPPSGKSLSRYADTAEHNSESPPPLYHFEKPTTRIRVVDVAETLVKDMIPYIQASARTIVSKIAAHKPSGNGAPYVSPMFGTQQMQPGEVLQHYINHSKARRDESLIDKFYQPSEVFRHERTAHFLRHMSAATDMVRRTLCTMTTMILTTASACGGHGGGGIYIPSCGIYRYPFPKRSGSLSSLDITARDAVMAMTASGASGSASFSASASPLISKRASVSPGGFSEPNTANTTNTTSTLTPAQQRALKLYPQMAAKLTPSAQRKNRITATGVEIVQPTFRGDNVYYVYQVAQHLHANGVLQHMCDTLFVQYMQTLENVPFTDPYGLASKTSFIVEPSRPTHQSYSSNNLSASGSLLGGPPRKPPAGPGGKKSLAAKGQGAPTSNAGGGVSPLEFNVIPDDTFLYDTDTSAFGNSTKALSYSNMSALRRESHQSDPSVVLGGAYQGNATPGQSNFMGADDSSPRGSAGGNNNNATTPQRGTSGGASPRRGKTTPNQTSKRSPKRGKGSGGGKRSPFDDNLPDLNVDAAHLVDSPRGHVQHHTTTLSLTAINFNQHEERNVPMLSSRSNQSELITVQMLESPLLSRPSSTEAVPTERTAVRAAPSSFHGSTVVPTHVAQQVGKQISTPTGTKKSNTTSTTGKVVSSSEVSHEHAVFVADVGMQTELTSEALEKLVANIHHHYNLTPTSSRRHIHSSQSNLSLRSTVIISPTSRQNREMLNAVGDGFGGVVAGHSSSSSVHGRGGYQVVSEGERTPIDDFAATVAMERDELLLSASGSCTPIGMGNHSLTSDYRAATRTQSNTTAGTHQHQAYRTSSKAPSANTVETTSIGTATSPPETRSVASQALMAKQGDRLDVELLSASNLSDPTLSSSHTAGLDELRGDNHVLASASLNVQHIISSGLLSTPVATTSVTVGGGGPIQLSMLVRSMLSQLSPGYLYYCLPTFEINSALRQLPTRRTRSITRPNTTQLTPSQTIHQFVVTVCVRSFASLWNFSPTGTAQAMALLRTLLRSEVSNFGGSEIKCEQDMFTASFPTALASMTFVDTVQMGAMRLPYHAFESSFSLLKNHPSMSEVPFSVLHTIPTDTTLPPSSTDSALAHLSRPVYQLEIESAKDENIGNVNSWLFEAVLAGFRSSVSLAKTSGTSQAPLSPIPITQTMALRQQSIQHTFETLFQQLNVTTVAPRTSGSTRGVAAEGMEGGPISDGSFISMNATPMEELLNAISSFSAIPTSTSLPDVASKNAGYFIQRGLPLVFGIGTSVEESLAAACDGIRTSFHSTTPFTVPSPSTVAQGVNGDVDADGCFFFTMPTGASLISTTPAPEIKSPTNGMSHSSQDFDLCSLSLRDADDDDSDIFKTVMGGASTSGTPLTLFGALVVASFCHAEATSTRSIVDGVVSHIQKNASGAGVTSSDTDAGDAQKGLPATKQGHALQSMFAEVRKNASGYSLASEKHLSALGYHVSMGVCCSIAFSKKYEEERTTTSQTAPNLYPSPLSVRNISGQTQEIITAISRKRWEFVYAAELSLLVSSRKWESIITPMNKSVSNVLSTTARLIFTSCPKLLFDRCSDVINSGEGSELSPRLLDGFVSDKERRIALIAQGKQTVPIAVKEAISAALNGRSSSLHTLILSAVNKVPALRRGVQLYEKLLSSCGVHPLQLLALEASSPADLVAYGPVITPKYPWSVSEVVEGSIRKLHLSSSSAAVSAIQEYRVTNSITDVPKKSECYNDHGGEMHDSTSSFTIEVSSSTPDGTSVPIPSNTKSSNNTNNSKEPEGKRLTFVVIEVEDSDAVLQEALGQEIIEAAHFGDTNFASTGVDELSIAPTSTTSTTSGAGRQHKKNKVSGSSISDAIVTVSYDSSRVHQAYYDHFEPHIYPPMLTHGRPEGNTIPGAAPTDQLQQRLNEKGRSLRHQLNTTSESIVKSIEQVALSNSPTNQKPSQLQLDLGPSGIAAAPTVYKCLNVEHFQQLCASVQRVSDKARIAQAVAAIDSDGLSTHYPTPPPPAKRVIMFAFDNPVDALAVACEAHHIALNAFYTPDVLRKIPSCGPKFSTPAAAAANARLARGGSSAAADGGVTTIVDEAVDSYDNSNNRDVSVNGDAGILEGVLWKGLKVRAAVAMATPSLEVVESNGGVYAYGAQVTFAMDLLYGAKFGETIVSDEVRQTVTDISAPPSVKCTYLEQHQRTASRDISSGEGGPSHHRANNNATAGGYSWWMVPSSVKYTFSTTSDRTVGLDQVLGQPYTPSPIVHSIHTAPSIKTAYVCLAKGLTARWHLLEQAHRQEEFEVKKLACMETADPKDSTVWMSCAPYHRQMYVGTVPLSILQIAQLTATSGTNVGVAATSTLADDESEVPLSKCLSQSVLATQAKHGIPLTNHRESFSHLARVGYAGTSSAVLSLLCFVKAHPLLLASALRDESSSVLISLERRMTKLLVEQDRERNQNSGGGDYSSSKSSNYHSDSGHSSPGRASKRQFNEAATAQQTVYTKNFEFLTSVVDGLRIECRSNIMFTLREAVLGATCITLGSLFESPSSLHNVLAAACLKVQLALRTALVGNNNNAAADHTITVGTSSSNSPGAKRASLGGDSIYSGPNLSSHPDYYPTTLPTTVSGDFSYVIQQYCGLASSTTSSSSQPRDDIVFVPFSPSDIERGLMGSWMSQSLKDVASQGVSPKRELKVHAGASHLLYDIAQLRPQRRQSALQEFLPLYISCLSESSVRNLIYNTMYFGDADEEYARWCMVMEQQFASMEDPSLSQQQHKPTVTLDELIRVDPEALQDHQDFVLSRYDTTAAGVSRIGILGQKQHHQNQEAVGVPTAEDTTRRATFASWPRKHFKQVQLRERQSTRYPGLSKSEMLRERLDFNQHQEIILSSTSSADGAPHTTTTATTTAAVSTVHMWNEVFTAAVIHHLGTNPELKKIINKEIVKQQSKYSLTRTASSGRVLGDGPRTTNLTSNTSSASSSSYRLPMLVVLQPIVEALMYQANELNAAVRMIVDRAAVQCDGIVRTPHSSTNSIDKDLTSVGAWVEYIVATYENSMWESGANPDQPNLLTPTEQQHQSRREMFGVNPPPPPPTFQVEFPDALKALHYSHQLKVALNRLPAVVAARRKTISAHTDVSMLSNPASTSIFSRSRSNTMSSSFKSGSGRNIGRRNHQGAGASSAQQAILHHKCLSVPIDSLLQCFGEHRGAKGDLLFIGPRVITAMTTAPFNRVVESIQFKASRSQLRFSNDATLTDAEALDSMKRRDVVAKNIYQRSLQISPSTTSQHHDGDQYLRIAAASTEQAVEDAIVLLMQICSNNQVAGGETAIHRTTQVAIRKHPLLIQPQETSASSDHPLLHIPYLVQPFVFFQRCPLPNAVTNYRSTTIENILHEDDTAPANAYILMVPKMLDSRLKFNDSLLSIAEENTLTDTKEEPASPLKSQQSVMFIEENSAAPSSSPAATEDVTIHNVNDNEHDPISSALRSLREGAEYAAKSHSVYAKTVRSRASCIAVMKHASSLVSPSQLSEVMGTLLAPLITFLSSYYGNANRPAAIPAVRDRHTLVQHVQNTMVQMLSMSMMISTAQSYHQQGPLTSAFTSTGAQPTTAITTTNNCEAYQYDARRLLSDESAKCIHAVREVMKALIAGPQYNSIQSNMDDVSLMTVVGDVFVCETDIARAVELADEVMQARSRPTTTDAVLLNMGGRPQKQQNWESIVVQTVVNRTQQKPPPLSSLTNDRTTRRSIVVSFFADTNPMAPTSVFGGGVSSASPTPDEAIASAIANPNSVMTAVNSLMSLGGHHRITNHHNTVTPSSRGRVDALGSFAFTPTPGGARGTTSSALARSFGKSALFGSVNAGSNQAPVVTPVDISICSEVQKHFRQLCAISTKAAKVMGYPQSTITTTPEGPNKVDGVLRNAIKSFNQSTSTTTTIDHAQLRGTLNVSMQDVQRASRGLLEDIMTALNCRAERPSRFHRSQQTLIAIPANNEATQVSDESSDEDSLVGGRGRRGLRRSNTMISFKGSTSSAAFGGMPHTESNLSTIPRRRSASRRQSILGETATSHSDNINARLFKKLKHIASGSDAVYNVGADGKVAINSKGDPKKGYSLGVGPEGNHLFSGGDGGGSNGGEMVVRSKEYRPGGGHDILSVQLRERMIIELEEELESLRASAGIRHQHHPGDNSYQDDEFDVKDERNAFSSTPTQNTSANPRQLISLPSLVTKVSGEGESSSEGGVVGPPPSTSSFKAPDFMGMLTAFNRPPLGSRGILPKSGTADANTQRGGKKVGASLPQNRASTTGQQPAQNLRLLPPLSSSATPTAGGDWVSLHQDGSNRNSQVDLSTRNISPIPHQQQPLSTSTTSGDGGQLVPHTNTLQQRGGSTSPIPTIPTGDLSSAFVVATINPTQDIRGDLHAPFSRHYSLQQRGVTPGVVGGRADRGAGGVAQHRVTRRNLSPMRNAVQKNTPARAPETVTNSSGTVPPSSRHRQASDPDIEGV